MITPVHVSNSKLTEQPQTQNTQPPPSYQLVRKRYRDYDTESKVMRYTTLFVVTEARTSLSSVEQIKGFIERFTTIAVCPLIAWLLT